MNYITLTIYDFLLTPVYLFIVTVGILFYNKTFIKDRKLRKYFLQGIFLKIAGALLLGIIYEFYYGGGDTSVYYMASTEIYKDFLTNPLRTLQIIFVPETVDFHFKIGTPYYHIIHDPASMVVVRMAAFFSLFCFNTYSVIAIFMGLLTFVGIWKLFVFLINLYPHLEKQFAISFLYMPSVFFWGSGLMKDGITLSALCLAFYCVAKFLLEKKKITYVIVFLISVYILASVKIYILICFMPAMVFWIFSTFNYKIKTRLIRVFVTPVLLVSGLLVGVFITNAISAGNDKYSFDTMLETAQSTSSYINRISEKNDGSSYSLGQYEPTLTGILPIAPKAIWVSLFRPYIWEIKNVPMFLSALECFFFLIVTLITLYKARVIRIFSVIQTDPYVQFALLFSMIFAFGIGISTYNFGTLVRYKIPLMPFYLSAIFIIKYRFDKKRKSISSYYREAIFKAQEK